MGGGGGLLHPTDISLIIIELVPTHKHKIYNILNYQ